MRDVSAGQKARRIFEGTEDKQKGASITGPTFRKFITSSLFVPNAIPTPK
jgi:hypothetical protein